MNDTIAKVQSTEPERLEDVYPVTPPAKPEPAKIVLSDDDKERFFKSFLSDEPYEETFSRLGGKLRITIRTLNVDENYDIFRQIDLDRKTGKAKNEDSYLMTIVQYRLAVSLVAVNGVPFAPDCDKTSFETDEKAGLTYVGKRAEELRAWPVH
ncbi:MAG: hypothetical protein EBU46_17070, partial [Nitrosomonadaceae bacterium]|nr:hypothetical protein [Nitrosomonadaceae bacterium]